MKWAFLVALSLCDSAPALLPELDAQGSGLKESGSMLLRDGLPFSGFVVARHANGALRSRKLYRRGMREGVHQGWWSNGQLQFEYRYVHDLFDGEQRAYHANGALAELRHYQAGHEEGLQRFFEPTGRVIANYTFKDGRRYGIVGRSDCVSR